MQTVYEYNMCGGVRTKTKSRRGRREFSRTRKAKEIAREAGKREQEGNRVEMQRKGKERKGKEKEKKRVYYSAMPSFLSWAPATKPGTAIRRCSLSRTCASSTKNSLLSCEENSWQIGRAEEKIEEVSTKIMTIPTPQKNREQTLSWTRKSRRWILNWKSSTLRENSPATNASTCALTQKDEQNQIK